MFTRRFPVAVLTGAIVLWALLYLFFEVAFGSFFVANAGSATGVPREAKVWWALLLSDTSLALLVALAVSWARAASILQGAKIGAIVGLLAWLGFDAAQYGLTNLWKFPVVIVDPLLTAIPYGIVGGVIVAVLGERTEPSARVRRDEAV